jgi:hypothetical protein
MKTLAIAQRTTGMDIWEDVFGTDISLGEAIMEYYDNVWSRMEESDRRRSQMVSINIVPVPDEDPEDGVKFEYKGTTYTLPDLWEETVEDYSTVVLKGKWLLPFYFRTEELDRDDFERGEACGSLENHSDVEIIETKFGRYAMYGWNGEYADQCWKLDEHGNPIGDTEYTITPVSVEVDEDLFETVGYKIEKN